MAKPAVAVCLAVLLVVCLLLGLGLLVLRPTRTAYLYPESVRLYPNPLIGYAPAADAVKKFTSGTRLAYVPIYWSALEPEEGVFDWDTLNETYRLAELREQGLHLVIRFICDYPGKEPHMDIPQWLYDKTADGTFYNISYGKGYSPDYANPTFIAAHAKAVAALGEHFGSDTFVSYIELGSLGHWGEWHVKTSAGIKPLPDSAARLKYITPWIDAFPHAKLLMRRPFAPAKEYGLGVYNDVTGYPSGTEEFLNWLEEGGTYSQTGETDAIVSIPNFWEIAPVGGEFTSGLSMEELLDTELDRTLELIRRSHVTFLGPKTAHAEYPAGYDAVLAAMGYRIHISAVERAEFLGSTILTLTWENTGAAPLYWDWPVQLYLEYPDGTEQVFPVELALSQLVPDRMLESVTTMLKLSLQKALDAGARLSVGIIDPMTGLDSVRLAMDVPYENGRNVLLTSKS